MSVQSCVCVCVSVCLSRYMHLVAECALLGADIGDEVPGLFGHLVQEHVAQGQTAVPDVMALHRGNK